MLCMEFDYSNNRKILHQLQGEIISKKKGRVAVIGIGNCIPVFISSSEYWNKRFKDTGLPILGDDIKS